MSLGGRPNSSKLMSGILHPAQTECNALASNISPATGFRFRELSHSRRNSARPCPNPARQFRASLRTKTPLGSAAGRKAPFAERTKTLNKLGPRGDCGQRGSFPKYNSLDDPHLFHYYARKFGFELMPPFPFSVNSARSLLNKRRSDNSFGNQTRQETRRISKTERTYKVTVKTGSRRNAGTLAKVFLMINGSKGKIHKQRLCEVSAQSTAFQLCRGSCHTFDVVGPDIGDIKSIFLEHDGLLEKHAWFVDEVSILDVLNGKSWHFSCKRWLSLFHNDCQLGRTFYPASTSDLQLISDTRSKSTGESPPSVSPVTVTPMEKDGKAFPCLCSHSFTLMWD